MDMIAMPMRIASAEDEYHERCVLNVSSFVSTQCDLEVSMVQ